ncbi:MAG: Ldh family oxidoreductase [Betaproteobacteria bacterium]|nr:Ldh family oxidoreductase [Betaproteobacteria bacterium]
MPIVSLEEITNLTIRALKRAGASKLMAQTTAQALVAAEAEGLGGHGLSRAALYCQHLREGRANGKVKPKVIKRKGGTALVDACGGLAFPACALAVKEVIARAKRFGVGYVGVTNSHHMGAVGYHLAPVAEAGLVGLAFTNSPPAINAWGGKRALFSTNPIAAVFPRKNGVPIVIDLSLSEVARGKIMVAAKEGTPIPLGWAVDKDGNPTTDAKAALTGSLMPIGGAKGAALAMMVEVLCTAVTGAAFSFENDSYFEPGNKPRIGHAILAIDPAALAGSEAYSSRMEVLIEAILRDDGVRLPGARRQKSVAAAREQGLTVGDALWSELQTLAAKKS